LRKHETLRSTQSIPSPLALPGEREQVAQARNTEINSVNPLSPGFAGGEGQVAQARNTEINSVNPLSPGFAGGEGAGCASTKHRDQLSQSPLPWLCRGRGSRLRKYETPRSTQSVRSPPAMPGERVGVRGLSVLSATTPRAEIRCTSEAPEMPPDDSRGGKSGFIFQCCSEPRVRQRLHQDSACTQITKSQDSSRFPLGRLRAAYERSNEVG